MLYFFLFCLWPYLWFQPLTKLRKGKLKHFYFIFLQSDFLNLFKDRVKAVKAPDNQNNLESDWVIVCRTWKQHRCFSAFILLAKYEELLQHIMSHAYLLLKILYFMETMLTASLIQKHRHDRFQVTEIKEICFLVSEN